MCAIPKRRGEIPEGVATRVLDIQEPVAIVVLQALREVVFDKKEVDPYFDDFRIAREHLLQQRPENRSSL